MKIFAWVKSRKRHLTTFANWLNRSHHPPRMYLMRDLEWSDRQWVIVVTPDKDRERIEKILVSDQMNVRKEGTDAVIKGTHECIFILTKGRMTVGYGCFQK